MSDATCPEQTTLQRLSAFFTAEDYRFRPLDHGYYAMVDGWKHDIGGDEFPGTASLLREAESLTADEWEAFIDALVGNYREGLLAGLQLSPYSPESAKRAIEGA